MCHSYSGCVVSSAESQLLIINKHSYSICMYDIDTLKFWDKEVFYDTSLPSNNIKLHARCQFIYKFNGMHVLGSNAKIQVLVWVMKVNLGWILVGMALGM